MNAGSASSALLAFAALAALVLIGSASANSSETSADNIGIQQARAKRVQERAAKAHYTKRWNLDDLPAYKAERQVSGSLRIWGTNYLTDGMLNEYWEEGFRAHHPDASFEYSTPTALVAIPGLYIGLADVGVSRKITFDETLAFQRIKGYHPLELTVVTGSYNVPGWSPALGIYVHKDNPITRLTLKQLDGIFGGARAGGFDESYAWRPDRGRGPEGNIRTWGQLGLKGEWANKPVNVYGLSLKYHQQMNIERKVFNGGSKWNENLREYAHFANPDGSTNISNVELLKDLSNDRYGISYSNEGYIRPEHSLRRVALADKEGGPYVELNIDNVRNRTYPLLDETYVYIDRRPGMPIDPLVKEFLRFILSREGQAAVMEDGKYLPLTAEVVAEQLKKLQ